MDQLSKSEEKKIDSNALECRKMHTSLRDHNADAKLCPYCTEQSGKNAYVETSEGRCTCCHRIIPQAKTYQTLKKILNKFVHEYKWLLDGDVENLTGDVWMLREGIKSQIILRIFHNGSWYETNIRNVALYYELSRFDRIPFPAPIEPEFITRKKNGGTIKVLQRVKWSNDVVNADKGHEAGTELSPRESVKLAKFFDNYDRYDSVMKYIDGKVVMLLK